MAQKKITANENRRKTLNDLQRYIKSNLEINLKDFYIWRIAFMLSLKNFTNEKDLESYKNEGNLGIYQNYETLIDDDTEYIFINLLCLTYNRKIDIKKEFPEMLKIHCRHGFELLEYEMKNIGVNDNIIDFFINQLEVPNSSNQKEDTDINKFEQVIKKIEAPLKFKEEKSFNRVTKLYFEVEDLRYATKNKLYGDDLINQLETGTSLENKIYIEKTKQDNMVSINIIKENQSISISKYESEMIDDNLSLIIGMGDEDNVEKENLTDLVHLFVAGTTGSGKTVFLHSLIYQLIRKTKIRLYLIDGKNGQEFGKYENDTNVIIDDEKIISTIDNISQTMKNRYKKKNTKKSTPIVLIIDEFVDLIRGNLIKGKSIIQDLVTTLAIKGRSAKIHLILATQRPDGNTLENQLLANVPSRIAFKVSKDKESKIILGETGAEKLLGKGDMLFSNGKEIKRLQGFLP